MWSKSRTWAPFSHLCNTPFKKEVKHLGITISKDLKIIWKKASRRLINGWQGIFLCINRRAFLSKWSCFFIGSSSKYTMQLHILFGITNTRIKEKGKVLSKSARMQLTLKQWLWYWHLFKSFHTEWTQCFVLYS